MNILFVARMLAEYGGAEQQLLILGRGLVKRGHSVHVATLYRGGKLEQDFGRAGIDVIDLGKTGRFAIVSAVRALRRLAADMRPDVIHGYLGLPNLMVLMTRGAASSSVIVAGLRASDVHLQHYDWLHRMLLRAEKQSIRWHDLAIVNSRVGEDYFRTAVPRAHLLHIPNGIDTERFVPDVQRRHRARAFWKIDAHVAVVGCVARLDLMKDHDTLLAAFAHAARQVPLLHLVCYGAGVEAARQRLKATAARLGIGDRVQWHEPVPDLQNWYPGFDVHCMSSAFGEGFPNVVAEAMACGVPGVVTDVGDAADIVGTTGWVVPPRQPVQLGDALVHALQSARADAGATARNRVVRLFSVDQLVNRTEAALLQASRDLRGAVIGECGTNATDDCLARIRCEELARVSGRFTPGTRLLEIGGGNGWQARLLADMGCEVSSIDVDPVGSWSKHHFSVRHYDGTHIPFAEGEFDCVFSSNVLEHVQDVAALLRDTRRVLKPGGIAVHIVPSPAWRFWTSLTHYPYVVRVFLVGDTARGAGAAQTVEAAVARRGLRYLIGRALFDGPHGTSPSAIHELAHFSRRCWRREFENAGFKVREDFPVGLFYTGHMLFARLSMNSRRVMSRVLGSACRVFVLER